MIPKEDAPEFISTIAQGLYAVPDYASAIAREIGVSNRMVEHWQAGTRTISDLQLRALLRVAQRRQDQLSEAIGYLRAVVPRSSL